MVLEDQSQQSYSIYRLQRDEYAAADSIMVPPSGAAEGSQQG